MKEAVYTPTSQAQLRRVLPDLIRGRRLWLTLVTKAVRIRYRYAAVGFLWAVIQPVAMMLILTFVIKHFLRIEITGFDGEGEPAFALALLCALVFWQFLSSALSESTRSIVNNADLVKKVYLPREVIPLASIGDAFVTLLIGCGVLFVFSLFHQGLPPETVVWLPAIFGIQLLITVGLALFMSAVNTHFRDIQYMLDVALMFGFYATPIFYDLRWAQAQFFETARFGGFIEIIYMANPMVGIVTAYRGAFLEGYPFQPTMLIWPSICALLLLGFGLFAFRRLSPTLADHL